jgi:hypothetical protein
MSTFPNLFYSGRTPKDPSVVRPSNVGANRDFFSALEEVHLSGDRSATRDILNLNEFEDIIKGDIKIDIEWEGTSIKSRTFIVSSRSDPAKQNTYTENEFLAYVSLTCGPNTKVTYRRSVPRETAASAPAPKP